MAFSSELINLAMEVAALAHKDQKRKGTDLPYIIHPLAVGVILAKAGYDDEIIAAGILHDTVEDTGVALRDILNQFGPRVAELVEGASEPDKSLPWIRRKEHMIHFLKTAPLDVRAVVCADKLHNIQSIRRDLIFLGEGQWKRFRRGREEQGWYYRNVAKSLGYEGRFELLDELEFEIDGVFGTL